METSGCRRDLAGGVCQRLVLRLKSCGQLPDCGSLRLDLPCLTHVSVDEFRYLGADSRNVLSKEGESSFHGCLYIL